MAAPTATARETPVGIPLRRGFSTKITLAIDPDISFWEKKIKPPGFDNGDKINTTTMFNDTYRSFASRGLIEMTDVTGVAAYDPVLLSQINAVCGVETTITITFPDGTTWYFYGYLKNFDPQELSEDPNQPEAQLTFVITNWDPTNKVEAGPGITNVSGT